MNADPTRRRQAVAAAIAGLLMLGATACEPDLGTEDTSPGPDETIPGEPGLPDDDIPENTGEDDL